MSSEINLWFKILEVFQTSQIARNVFVEIVWNINYSALWLFSFFSRIARLEIENKKIHSSCFYISSEFFFISFALFWSKNKTIFRLFWTKTMPSTLAFFFICSIRPGPYGEHTNKFSTSRRRQSFFTFYISRVLQMMRTLNKKTPNSNFFSQILYGIRKVLFYYQRMFVYFSTWPNLSEFFNDLQFCYQNSKI